MAEIVDLRERFAEIRSEISDRRDAIHRSDLRGVAITRLAHRLTRDGHSITEVAHALSYWGSRFLEGTRTNRNNT